MSIEKFNPLVEGEQIPYLQANRHVIQNITNTDALAVWVYLLTLPPDWSVIKEHLQKHFGIGQDKTKKVFAYLKRVNLIDYVKARRADGTLGTTKIVVLNGSKFNDGIQDLSPKVTTGVETTPLENHTCGNQLLHIKQNTNEISNKKSSCLSDQKKHKAVDNKPIGENQPMSNKAGWKEANQKKPAWAEPKKAPLADVTKQSTSYDPDKHRTTPTFDANSPGYQAFLDANPAIKRRKARQATELPTGTALQPEVPATQHHDKQSSEHVTDSQSYLSPPVRDSNRVMETRRVCSLLEEVRLAN